MSYGPRLGLGLRATDKSFAGELTGEYVRGIGVQNPKPYTLNPKHYILRNVPEL